VDEGEEHQAVEDDPRPPAPAHDLGPLEQPQRQQGDHQRVEGGPEDAAQHVLGHDRRQPGPRLAGGGGHRLQRQPGHHAEPEEDRRGMGGQAAGLVAGQGPGQRQPADQAVEVAGLEVHGPRQHDAPHGHEQRPRQHDRAGPLGVAAADVEHLGQVGDEHHHRGGHAQAQGARRGGGVEPAGGLHREPQGPAQHEEDHEQQAVVAAAGHRPRPQPEPAPDLVVVLLQRSVEQLGREGDEEHQPGHDGGAGHEPAGAEVHVGHPRQ
jgi:hypothetical protein